MVVWLWWECRCVAEVGVGLFGRIATVRVWLQLKCGYVTEMGVLLCG